ncbi:MAG: ATP-binding protein, partial [Planctomycetota bacterium]
ALGSTWDAFERYKRQGLDARRAGQWGAARTYLLEAARCMSTLAKEARSEQLQNARRETAEKLLDLARDCKQADEEGRAPTPNARRATKPGNAKGPDKAASSDGGDGPDASAWAVREKPDLRFDDVAGLEDVKDEIRLKMLYPFRHPELAEKFGITPGGGILLYGPPGTGKTMLARATAGELDAVFFTVSAADLLSKWVGEAEQNVKALFDAATNEERSVIFIDEIESLVPARRDEGGSSVMQRVVPQILQGMEGFAKKKGQPVLFMGATNVPWQLDPAVLRPGRFDEKVYVDLPDLPARTKLLEIHLGHRPLAGDVDLPKLADRLAGYSGADIKYLCDRAATIPFLESVVDLADGVQDHEPSPITTAILDRVITASPPSVTKDAVQRFEGWRRQVDG